MKNTVYVRAFVAADIVAKTLNLAFRVSDLLEISSEDGVITIRKVSCALCGHAENIRQYLRDKWLCDKCAEEISKGVIRDSRFIDTAGSYDAGGKYGADTAASSGTGTAEVSRDSYTDYDKEFEQRNGVGV